jgi:glucose/arabinose dehydrogenase
MKKGGSLPDIYGRVALRARTAAAPALALALTFLSACGGDGSTQPAPPNQPPPNQPPVFSSAAAASVVENVAGGVYQAAASDPNGDSVTYSIAGGADAARFTMSASGQLSFVSSPNYDLPSDADADNVYEIQIGASDGKASTTLALSLTVTNSKEGVAVHRIATGFANPVAIAPISATAMLVAEKAGAVYLLNPETGTKTLLVQMGNVGNVGVTALAAAPTFATDGAFFVMYTTPTGYLVIDRYLRNPAGPTVLAGPLLVVSAPQYAGGGWLGYDASGALLAATSDAGDKGDPSGSAQDDASRLGKLLRIVPNPDPYAGASPVYFLISTVAKGFHQPNGGSQFGNNVLLADHGQDVAEEIDLVSGATGSNFGWPFKEATRTVSGNPPAGLIDPVLEYFRSTGLRTGQAIVGGAIGPSAVASLRNQYILADGSGTIFAVDTRFLSAGTTASADVVERRDADFAPDAGTITHPVAITAGPGGTLFILDADGDVFRVDGS